MRASATLQRLSRGAGIDARGLATAVVAGLLGGLVVLANTAAVPVVVFSGVLERYLGVGLGLAIVSTMVTCATLALLSSYPAALAHAQLTPAVSLGVIGASMVDQIAPDAPDGVVFGTLLLMIVLASLSFGLILLVLGWRRRGNLVRFMPTPVMGGFLAFVALMLIRNGLGIMLGQPLTPDSGALLVHADQLPRWLPALLFALVLVMLQGRRPHALNLPVAIACAVGLFWLAAGLAGVPSAALQAAGYLLPPVGLQGSGAMWSLGALIDALGHADVRVVLQQLPQLVGLCLVSVIGLLLVASNIEIATRSDIDFNQELKSAGAANLLAGLCGALPGFHSLNGCVLPHTLGTKSRLVGLVGAALCAVTLLFAGALVPYLPKMLLGFVLFYLALGIVMPEVLRQWAWMATIDRAILLLVLASLLLFGFLPGIAIGLVAALVMFAASYARIDIVRAVGGGERFRSNVFRPSGQLRSLAERADDILVVRLQGYVFFGSAHRFLNQVKARLQRPARGEARFLILDFARVEGADASALFAFLRLLQEAEEQRYAVLFAGLPEALSKALQAAGLDVAGQAGLYAFPDLDHALEHAENAILGSDRAGAPQSGLEELQRMYPEVGVRRQLMTYAERVRWQPGDVAMHQADPSDAILFVESGRLTAWHELPDGGRIRLRTIMPGTVIGEVGFYGRSPRSGSIVADQASSAFRLTTQAVRRMQHKDPRLASLFHRFMVVIIAERAADNVRLLAMRGA